MKKTVNGVRPIVFPSQIWTGTSGAGTPQSCIIYSLDRGQTWISEDTGKAGTLGIGASSSECVVTELSDGRLMLNARNENRSGYRKIFTTDDMGKTWTAHATNLKALPEPAACPGQPACRGKLREHRQGPSLLQPRQNRRPARPDDSQGLL